MDAKEILAELRKAKAERRELRMDIDNLAIATKNSFDRVDKRFDGLEERMDGFEQEQKEMRGDINRIERGVKAILEVVQENSVLLKEFRTHPDRIARLEHRVFK